MSLTKATYSMIDAKIGNIRDYGAVGNGIADDTAAIQACINDGNYFIYVPPGEYKYTNLTIPNAVRFYGVSYLWSRLVTAAATGGIKVTTAQTCVFDNLGFFGSGSHTGTLLDFDPTSGSRNTESIIENCYFYDCANGLSMTNAAGFNVSNCNFITYRNSAVFLANSENPDVGDSTVYGCIFSAQDETQGYGIFQSSSGGLRVTNNKFLGGLNHYKLYLEDAAATSILLIEGNSFEFCGQENISITSPGATGSFRMINIIGNQFSVSTNKIGIRFHAQPGVIAFVNISDNILRGDGAWTGMKFKNVQGLTIGPNTITTFGAGPTGTGIEYETGVSTVTYREQSFSNILTTVTGLNLVSGYRNVDTPVIFGAGFNGLRQITGTNSIILDSISNLAVTMVLITDSTSGGVAFGLATPAGFVAVSNTLSNIALTLSGTELLARTTGGAANRDLFIVGLTTGPENSR